MTQQGPQPVIFRPKWPLIREGNRRGTDQGWCGGASRRHTCWHRPGRGSSPCTCATLCRRSCACSSPPAPSTCSSSTDTASPRCVSLHGSCCINCCIGSCSKCALCQLAKDDGSRYDKGRCLLLQEKRTACTVWCRGRLRLRGKFKLSFVLFASISGQGLMLSLKCM